MENVNDTEKINIDQILKSLMPYGDWIKYSKQLKGYLYPTPFSAHKPHLDRKTEHTVSTERLAKNHTIITGSLALDVWGYVVLDMKEKLTGNQKSASQCV